MKKLLLIIVLIAVSVAVSIPSATIFAEADSGVDEALETEANGEVLFSWDEWIKEKALPMVISVGAGIAAFCTLLYPILRSISGGIKLFKKSKDEFDVVTRKVIETQTDITEFKDTALKKMEEFAKVTSETVALLLENSKEELGDIKVKVADVLLNYEQKLIEMSKRIEYLTDIAKIGFCNTEELVKNGYAREIMKVGVDDEYTQIEETDNADSPS